MRRRGFRPRLESLDARVVLSSIPIFSIGVNASGGLLPLGSREVHFELFSAPPDVAHVTYVMNSLPFGYVANTATSQWIGPSANPFGQTTLGGYVYRMSFDLGGFDPSTASVHLRLASDNASSIFLNGGDTGIALSSATTSYETLHDFDITSGFDTGVNVIDVHVHNDFSPTGIQLALTGEATPNGISAPTQLTASRAGETINVAGTFSGPPNTSFNAEYFASPYANPALLDSIAATRTFTTDASGFAPLSAALMLRPVTDKFVFVRVVNTSGQASPLAGPVAVLSTSNLSVAISASAQQWFGNHAVYVSIPITNDGPDPASNVVVTLTQTGGETTFPEFNPLEYPPGSTVVTLSPLSIRIPSVAAGTSGLIRAVYGTRRTTPITFTATISSDSTDPNPANDSASLVFPIPVITPPILDSAVIGSTSTRVTGTISGMPSTSYRVDLYHIHNPLFMFDGPVLLPAGSVDVFTDALGIGRFVASIPNSDIAVPFLTASMTGPGGTSDFSQAIPETKVSDLSVSIGSSPATVQVGQAFSVAVQVTNAGPSTSRGTELRVELPSTVTYGLQPFAPGSDIRFGDGVILITLPDLVAGQGASFRLLVSAATTGPVEFVARVSGPIADPSPANNVASASVSVVAAPTSPGPVVVKLERVGVHNQPTRVRLRFNEALVTSTAEDLANYRIVEAGADGKFGTKDDHLVALRSAAYNAATSAVTLTLKRKINLHKLYEVIATGRGPQGIRGLSGLALNARANGEAGPDYRAVVRGFWLRAR